MIALDLTKIGLQQIIVTFDIIKNQFTKNLIIFHQHTLVNN